MRKLNLKIEDLAVESFETTQRPRGRGTVQGHETWDGCPPTGYVDSCRNGSCGGTCFQATCAGRGVTCIAGYTCDPTCDASCNCTDPNVECGGGNLCKQSGSCIEDTEFYTGPVL